MEPVVVIDLETRSACNLKECGSYQYAKHETTRLLTVAWREPDGSYHCWLPGLSSEPPLSYRNLHLPNVQVYVGEGVPLRLCRARRYPWVGHNSFTFDRLVWTECTERCDPVEWRDTYPLALASGLPGGLDSIGKLLWGEGKYVAGKNELKKASRATSLSDCEPENVPLGQLMLVAKYNVQDTLLTWNLYEKVMREAKLPPMEERVKRAHDTINNRGVRIDRPLVKALIHLADQSKSRAIEHINILTEGALPDQAAVQSRARVLKWLDDQGLKFTSLRKEIVSRFIDTTRADLEDEEEPTGEQDESDSASSLNLSRIVKVLELRMQALRITGGKLDTALWATDADDRLRHWSVYWGAHTGRWAGRRFQPHNLPRPKEGVDTWALLNLFDSTGSLDYDAVRNLLPLGARDASGKLLYPYLSVDDAASALIRSIVVPDAPDEAIAAADYSNIEARVLAWCAGEQWLMDAFWSGADPYMAMAQRIFGPTDKWPQFPDPKKAGAFLPLKKHPYRQVGKVVVLGSGYQLGPDKFALYAAANGIDLSVVDTMAAKCIYSYRMMHSRIAGEYVGDGKDGRPRFRGGLWYELNQAVLMAITDCVETYAGNCAFRMSGENLICILPSGRRLVYRKARIDRVHPPWCEDPNGVPAACYWSPRYGYKYLYGGSIAENLVQAIARDCLANGLVKLEEAGLPIVLHVHDELVCSIPGCRPKVWTRYSDFMKLVTEPPEWLDKFPLQAEGSLAPRYAKTPPPGEYDETWRNGAPIKAH